MHYPQGDPAFEIGGKSEFRLRRFLEKMILRSEESDPVSGLIKSALYIGFLFA